MNKAPTTSEVAMTDYKIAVLRYRKEMLRISMMGYVTLEEERHHKEVMDAAYNDADDAMDRLMANGWTPEEIDELPVEG